MADFIPLDKSLVSQRGQQFSPMLGSAIKKAGSILKHKIKIIQDSKDSEVFINTTTELEELGGQLDRGEINIEDFTSNVEELTSKMEDGTADSNTFRINAARLKKISEKKLQSAINKAVNQAKENSNNVLDFITKAGLDEIKLTGTVGDFQDQLIEHLDKGVEAGFYSEEQRELKLKEFQQEARNILLQQAIRSGDSLQTIKKDFNLSDEAFNNLAKKTAEEKIKLRLQTQSHLNEIALNGQSLDTLDNKEIIKRNMSTEEIEQFEKREYFVLNKLNKARTFQEYQNLILSTDDIMLREVAQDKLQQVLTDPRQFLTEVEQLEFGLSEVRKFTNAEKKSLEKSLKDLNPVEQKHTLRNLFRKDVGSLKEFEGGVDLIAAEKINSQNSELDTRLLNLDRDRIKDNVENKDLKQINDKMLDEFSDLIESVTPSVFNNHYRDSLKFLVAEEVERGASIGDAFDNVKSLLNTEVRGGALIPAIESEAVKKGLTIKAEELTSELGREVFFKRDGNQFIAIDELNEPVKRGGEIIRLDRSDFAKTFSEAEVFIPRGRRANTRIQEQITSEQRKKFGLQKLRALSSLQPATELERNKVIDILIDLREEFPELSEEIIQIQETFNE